MQPNPWNQPPYTPQEPNQPFPYGFQQNGIPPQMPPVKPAPSPEFLEKKALQSFTMGILSSLGLFFPVLAFVFGAIGIYSSVYGMKSNRKLMAQISLVLCIIFIALAFCSIIVNLMTLFQDAGSSVSWPDGSL